MTLPSDLVEQARGVHLLDVAAHLKLRRIGAELVGACPACGGTDRFSIHAGRGKWNCRGAMGGHDAIGLAMHIYGIDFRAAVEMLSAGLAHDLRRPARQASVRKEERGDAERLAVADAIWRAAVPIAGTSGEAYLMGRGIALNEAPDHAGLRFHPACPYGPRRIVPCVVARYTDIVTSTERGIHRRAIVRLWPDEDLTQGLVIGEGIETVLAAATRIEHRRALLRPAWACGSAGTLENFPVLPGVEGLTILADHDASGRGQEAAARCAERWADQGIEVTIITPRNLGDMNDIV